MASRAPYWTAAEDRRFVSMWTDGQPVSVIADRLGKSVNSIAGRRNRMNLPKRENPITTQGKGGERLSRFAQHLADGLTIPETRLQMGINKDQAAGLFKRIKADLGWQAC